MKNKESMEVALQNENGMFFLPDCAKRTLDVFRVFVYFFITSTSTDCRISVRYLLDLVSPLIIS